MKITFMIGNGFDKNCGLACSYRDVYKSYIKTSSTSKTIMDFKNRISVNIDNWSDFESAMAKDMKNYLSENDFITCVRDFKKSLNEHLKEEDRKFNDRLKRMQSGPNDSVRHEMGQSLRYFYDGISHNISNRMDNAILESGLDLSVISFNYTSALDSLLDLSPYIASTIHVHGTIDDDIVLGMDNESQLRFQSFQLSRKAKRAFLKPFFNSEYDSQRVTNARNIINRSKAICVFGMSLGESDLMWRELLLSWIRADSSHHLFVYRHRYSTKIASTADERLDIEEDAKEELLTSLGVKQEEFESYYKQLHIPCGRNIFNIDKAIELEGKNQLQIAKGKQYTDRVLKMPV